MKTIALGVALAMTIAGTATASTHKVVLTGKEARRATLHMMTQDRANKYGTVNELGAFSTSFVGCQKIASRKQACVYKAVADSTSVTAYTCTVHVTVRKSMRGKVTATHPAAHTADNVCTFKSLG